MSKPENPRAFPSSAIDDSFGGMTLRDWFAGQALGGFAVSLPALVKWNDSAVAGCAYKIADAMLAERSK